MPDERDERGAAPGRPGPDDVEEFEDLDEEAVLAELDEARRRLAEVPAAQVVANHAMGLFELGAIHLSRQPPDLGEASMAIDAMAAIVEELGERLGQNAGVLRDALAQIRLAFVQVKQGEK